MIVQGVTVVRPKTETEGPSLGAEASQRRLSPRELVRTLGMAMADSPSFAQGSEGLWAWAYLRCKGSLWAGGRRGCMSLGLWLLESSVCMAKNAGLTDSMVELAPYLESAIETRQLL